MANHLEPERVREVYAQLAAGESQRSVARRTGVSRSTVRLMALGRRPDFEQQARVRAAARAWRYRKLKGRTRCPGCGALLTVLPCVACDLRRRAVKELFAIGAERPLPIVGLELRPEEAARYEEVRK